jgi:hypothetical protein
MSMNKLVNSETDLNTYVTSMSGKGGISHQCEKGLWNNGIRAAEKTEKNCKSNPYFIPPTKIKLK